MIMLMCLNICYLPIYADTEIDEPSIVATTAVILDAETKTVLYSKSMDQTMYPASITKVMTALLAIEALEAEEKITFSESAIHDYEDFSSSIGMRVGESITVDQALHGLLLMSANEVALGLAEAHSGSVEAFSQAMNDKAVAIGAGSSHFINPHGLHSEDHYTTAYDMALITSEALKFPYFTEIMSHSMYEIGPTNKSDDIRYLAQQHKMLNEYKDQSIYRDDVIAGKSGYTYESGHTLITVAKMHNRSVIVVILDSDANNLYTDTNKLIDYAYEVINQNPDAFVTASNLYGLANQVADQAEFVRDYSISRINEGSVSTETSVTETVSTSPLTDDTTEEPKSKSPVFVIIIILLVLIVVGALLVLDQKISMKKRRQRTLANRQRFNDEFYQR